jgi:hypothetical protein
MRDGRVGQRVLWADDGLELRSHAFDATWSDTIASNYRSVLTTALLADGPDPATTPRRLAVLTSHAHGAASLAAGELEVMVQRRLLQDDGLGMNEAMDERAPFSSALWLVLETGAVSPATVLARKRLARQLDAVVPLPVLVPADPRAWAGAAAYAVRTALASPLPDAVQLLSLHTRNPPSTAGATAVVLRLAHAVAVGEEPVLSGPARFDLSSLWAPPLALAAMAATGLTLGPAVFGASVPLPTVELGALDLRTWVLTLAS